MSGMAMFPGRLPLKSVWLVLCAALSISQGCARPDAIRRSEASANSSSGEQRPPFHPTPDRAADDSARPAVPSDAKSAGAAPFPTAVHWRSLPAGTLITVRLESSLSILQVRAGDSFTASVAGPLTVDGDTLIEPGASVTGRVEATQPPVDRPGSTPDPGLVRLTLNTITVEDRELGLQTSSLFAKGSFQTSAASSRVESRGRSSDVCLLKGRRLTFRLTAPLTVGDPNSIAERQSLDTSKP